MNQVEKGGGDEEGSRNRVGSYGERCPCGKRSGAEHHEGQMVTKCKEAAQLVNEKGLEAAFQELLIRTGSSYRKTHMCLSLISRDTSYPSATSGMVGKNVIESKDSNGKVVVKELIEVAKTKGEGWVEYMYPNPQN